MKKYLLLLCVVLLCSCKEETAKPETVEEEIKAVVTGETLAYMQKDYERWASFWDHSSDVLRLDVTKTGFSQTRGWENSGGDLKTFFEENPEPITSTFVNSNYFMLYDLNLAWVAFDQTWTTQSGEDSKAKATITMVKKDNSWKIIAYTAIQYDSEGDDVDTLERE